MSFNPTAILVSTVFFFPKNNEIPYKFGRKRTPTNVDLVPNVCKSADPAKIALYLMALSHSRETFISKSSCVPDSQVVTSNDAVLAKILNRKRKCFFNVWNHIQNTETLTISIFNLTNSLTMSAIR